MDRMPPPGSGHPGIAVTIPAKPSPDKMPPPGMTDKPTGDGKVSPEEAEVYRADQTCVNCSNYDPTSGDCSKVSGSFDPSDGCVKYFEAIGDDTPKDPDDGSAPDDDEETGS